jgi:predicted nucleic acid-binding protein
MSIKNFDVEPPGLAYGDASFFVALLEENEQFHDECIAFSAKLQTAKSIVVLSALGLDEIWYALLRIHGAADYGQKEHTFLFFLEKRKA